MLRRTMFGLVCVVGCLAALPAMAQFTVCNENAKLAYVAMGYWDNTQYVSDGWWTVDPGSCTVTYSDALPHQFYYVYAETEADKTGTVLTWGGETLLCINPSNNFTIWGDINCDIGFFEIDIGKATDWTFTLQ